MANDRINDGDGDHTFRLLARQLSEKKQGFVIANSSSDVPRSRRSKTLIFCSKIKVLPPTTLKLNTVNV